MTMTERLEAFIRMNSHHCHGPSAMDLLRDLLAERTAKPPVHPLKPTGAAWRHRLVAARINLRREA